jgi:hypothetical protein
MDQLGNDRIGKFFDENEYDLEVQMAYEYLSDINQKVYLYAVDISQGNIDNVYREAYQNEIVLKEPVELYGLVDVLEPKNQAYNDDNTLRINELGNMLVHVLIAELKFKNVNPKYGDYLVYMIDDGLRQPFPLVYQIANDANRFYENVRSWAGFKSHFKTLVCTPVDKNELKFEF